MQSMIQKHSKAGPELQTQRAAQFDWPLADEAEKFLRGCIQSFLDSNCVARVLAERMRDETGTDIFEWTDHLVLPPDEEPALNSAGFEPEQDIETSNGEAIYTYPRATLPRVLVPRGNTKFEPTLALRPEFIAEFIAAHHLRGEPEGESCSRFRKVLVAYENGTRLEAVERRAYRGFVPAPLGEAELRNIVKAQELWAVRPRLLASDAEGIQTANETLSRVLELVGKDMACHFFFEAERAYWQKRNRAGQLQKQRQDLLGLGWGNHDHHTFRCSRAHFVELVEFLLKLGFHKRERYYAGAEAGWGAQIMEQPTAGIVVFADVDLMPDETQLDFSSHRLPPAAHLGTVGLWVGLHGESFLQAGMHHLEARFDFELLRDQLKECGVTTMKPFSDFPFLRQAFTEGERWPVRRDRLESLLASRLITREQFDRFLSEGALGSHLENLQRHGGFKGFNQKSVSVIIAATDPRREHFAGAPVGAA